MEDAKPSIAFHLDHRSGVPPYLQIVRQVKHALRLGFLLPGDQLPTVRQVVATIAINPNTVFKAYRELEFERLVDSQPGVGTFVTRTLVDAALASHEHLRVQLVAWIEAAQRAGVDDESIEALFYTTLHSIKVR